MTELYLLQPVLANLLHVAEDAGPEEDLGVAQPELLLLQLDGIEYCTGSALVILRLRYGLRCQNVVPRLELGVGNFVGEALKLVLVYLRLPSSVLPFYR